MRWLPSFVCLAAGLSLAASAQAQLPSVSARMPCHDYHKIADTLGKRYGETPVSIGLQTNGHMLQVFSSPESGSWTILSVAPSGIGCIIAAGQRWQTRPSASADTGVCRDVPPAPGAGPMAQQLRPAGRSRWWRRRR